MGSDDQNHRAGDERPEPVRRQLRRPMRSASRATMRDVAALAGVSLKTVSRVINHESGVSAELSTRVQAAAEQLKFRPNLGARSLRRADGRTATIGLVLEDLANPFSAKVHRAIEDVARQNDVAVLAGSGNESQTREFELVAAFAARRIDGLVMMPTSLDQGYLTAELTEDTPVVFVDRSPQGIEADVVLTDNIAGATLAVRHLIKHGHRDIAFLGDRRTLPTAAQRLAGYSQALSSAGVTMRPEFVVEDLHGEDAAQRAVLNLLSLPEPPTALFTAQNMISIGALRALRARGAQRRCAMVGFDDFPLADLMDPPVTVVAQDTYELGRRAALQLFARMNGDVSPEQRQVLLPELVVRGSAEFPP